MNRSDDDLIRSLGEALHPSVTAPQAGRDAIRAMAQAGGRVHDVDAWFTRRRRRRFVVAAGALAGAAVVFVAGMVVGSDLPGVIRSAAHTIGLPVDSPTLHEARGVLHSLGEAVGRSETGDPTPNVLLDEIQALDDRMLALVAELDDGEKAKIVPVAHEVHLRAVQVLTEAGRPPPSPPGSAPATPAP